MELCFFFFRGGDFTLTLGILFELPEKGGIDKGGGIECGGTAPGSGVRLYTHLFQFYQNPTLYSVDPLLVSDPQAL